ncbi:spore germination protein GerPC [Halalkalibacter akibai]|uniref:Uncharacterized protein n=1 Tax=Halalkalibacter akibai (strain ATCC 43226 / DSM 21942 / CIP 109018 / JCM 9157 / 1139) TaxID=1236973 RepID=W4QQV7_HALA3|nr:spore germination protein GerPC [Halalkalibacter akibai]GAE34317.1 hypothetical protein JCM9157_1365 [Halalkalibacter akibai JCM 9157]
MYYWNQNYQSPPYTSWQPQQNSELQQQPYYDQYYIPYSEPTNTPYVQADPKYVYNYDQYFYQEPTEVNSNEFEQHNEPSEVEQTQRIKESSDELHQKMYSPSNQKTMNINLMEQLTKHMTALTKKLEEIEKENKELKEKVENMKPINIENINYKIQELTVEELSGNLMIGMTTLGEMGDLQKLLNDNNSIQFNDIDTENFEQEFEEKMDEVNFGNDE